MCPKAMHVQHPAQCMRRLCHPSEWPLLQDALEDHTDSSCACMQALAELEYPGKLQRLLLTPEREVRTPHCLLSGAAFTNVL